jgi:hypothetical protein
MSATNNERAWRSLRIAGALALVLAGCGGGGAREPPAPPRGLGGRGRLLSLHAVGLPRRVVVRLAVAVARSEPS